MIFMQDVCKEEKKKIERYLTVEIILLDKDFYSFQML